MSWATLLAHSHNVLPHKLRAHHSQESDTPCFDLEFKRIVNLFDEVVFEGVDDQHGQLLAITNALSDLAFVLGALDSQEVPLAQR